MNTDTIAKMLTGMPADYIDGATTAYSNFNGSGSEVLAHAERVAIKKATRHGATGNHGMANYHSGRAYALRLLQVMETA